VQVAGPVIEITDPPITLTRGANQVINCDPITNKRDCRKNFLSCRFKERGDNQQSLQVDNNGLFRSEVAIEEPLTVVKIVATDKHDNSSVMIFNLLANIQEPAQVTG